MVIIKARDVTKIESGPTREPDEDGLIEKEVSFETKEEFEKNKGKSRGTEVFE